MHSNHHRSGSWFGHGGRNGWLAPLGIGIGIGALIFSLLPFLAWAHHDDRGGRHGFGAAQEFRREAPGAVPPATERYGHHGRGPGTSWSWGVPFFPFGGTRLLLPLLLIGLGAWLISGGRRGPDGPSGRSHRGEGEPFHGPPGPPPGTEPRTPPDPPATGETRRL